jgi:hypothetical protein
MQAEIQAGIPSLAFAGVAFPANEDGEGIPQWANIPLWVATEARPVSLCERLADGRA